MNQSVNAFLESKTIEKVVPREFQVSYLGLTNKDDLSSLTRSLSDPIYDLLDRGGKRWRPALCFITAEIFGRPVEEVYDIAAAIELIHNGTLVVDDIEDSSPVRRNKPCVHLLYGVDVSINAGNFMYFAPIEYLLQQKYNDMLKYRMVRTCIKSMTAVHFGQAWDIWWHNNCGTVPTIEQYIKMAENKTGILSGLAVQLSCIVLGQSEQITAKLGKYASQIGVAFQIQDDILNLTGSDKYKATKGFLGEDIHEGKLSLIVIHSLTQDPKSRLSTILKMKTSDSTLIQEGTGSIQYAHEESIRLIEQAWLEVEGDLVESVGKQKLKMFAQYLIDREY